MIDYSSACKYETIYKGPFAIRQYVDKWYGHIKIWCNKKLSIIYVALIHKYDTKVDDY